MPGPDRGPAPGPGAPVPGLGGPPPQGPARGQGQGPGLGGGRGRAQFAGGAPLPSTPEAVVKALLGDEASETTKATIAKASGAPQMVALALGSPEFQRR